MEPIHFVLLFLSTWHTAKVSALSIISPTLFEEGSKLAVTCSAAAVDLDQREVFVSQIKLERRLFSDDSSEKEELARINFYKCTSTSTTTCGYKTTTISELWKFGMATRTDFLGIQEKSDTRDLMTITMTNEEASCNDAGHYYCSVTFGDGLSPEKSDSQSANATVGVSNLRMTVVPDYREDGQIGSIYRANESITVTCTANGPEDSKFTWERQCSETNTGGFQPWPVKDTGKHQKNPARTLTDVNQCGLYKHSQILTFDMTKELDDCMVRCGFDLEGSQPSLHANFSLLLRDEDNPDPDPSPSKAGADDLAIGLGVSLSLLAVIVIAVLIYVCWWRKRTPKNKDKEVANVEDPNQFVAPSMLYSKPNKPVKNDARGDKLNGEENSYDEDDDELPPKALYANESSERQAYDRNRQNRRRSQRSSGDYYNYAEDDDYPSKSRHGSHGGDRNRHASTDVTRSGDESADLSESGYSRPKPKRRTKLPAKTEEKELHYADLDITKKAGDESYEDPPGRYNRNRRNRKNRGREDEENEEDKPIQYASIRV